MDTMGAIVVWGLLGLMAWAWIRFRTKSRSHKPAQARHEWPALGDYEQEVVGESFYQSALKQLARPHGDDAAETEVIAHLVPDDDNPHDNKAVRVQIGEHTVGHLSREHARKFRRRLGALKLSGQTTSCPALIVGGFKLPDGERASYGVMLDLKPLD